MPLYGNFGEDVRDEHDKRPLRREDEPAGAVQRGVYPMQYRYHLPERTPAEKDDLATRVAADLFVESFAICTEGSSDDRYINHVAQECIRAGRIFAEAVAKEGK